MALIAGHRYWIRRLPAFAPSGSNTSVSSRIAHCCIALAIFAAAFALRFAVDRFLPPGFPYLTFFPAVIITGFTLGVRLGALVSVLSGLAAWYFFLPPVRTFSMSASNMIAMGFYVVIVCVDLALIYLVTRAYRAESLAKIETEQLAERQDVLTRELDHRLKNIFATISAIVGLSQKHASTPQELAERLREKLDAMGRSNLLLRGLAGSDQATLAAVLEQALLPFGVTETERVKISGPALSVSGQSVLALSLIFHELGTNAVKYGALSTPSGEIGITWLIGTGEGGPSITIEWKERGGPSPIVSDHRGFGSTLIRRVIAGLGGTTHTHFPAQGAHIQILLPLSALENAT